MTTWFCVLSNGDPFVGEGQVCPTTLPLETQTPEKTAANSPSLHYSERV